MKSEKISLYINGSIWSTDRISEELIELIANNRIVLLKNIQPFLNKEADILFLEDLFKQQWLEFY